MLVCYGSYDCLGYSTDEGGHIWNPVPSPVATLGGLGIAGLALAPYSDVAVITGSKVMVGPGDPTAWADVSVWQDVGVFTGQGYYSAAYSENLGLFAIGSSLAAGTPNIATSPDGVTWTTHPLAWPSLRQVDVIRWIEDLGIFVAGGAYNGYGDYVPRIVTSRDGYAWTERAVPAGQGATLQEFAWSPELGVLVAVGSYGFRAASVDGGVTWTRHDEATWLHADSVIWVPELSRFIASGLYLSESYDGITWTYTGRGASGRQMIFLKDHFITSGNTDQALAESSDATFPALKMTWIPSAVTPGPSTGLAWSKGAAGIEVFPDLLTDPPSGTLENVRRTFV